MSNSFNTLKGLTLKSIDVNKDRDQITFVTDDAHTVCPQCKYRVHGERGLKMHMRQVHGAEPKPMTPSERLDRLAAAPNLLDGCKALLGLLDLIGSRDDMPGTNRNVLATNHRVEEARAAVAKAEAR